MCVCKNRLLYCSSQTHITNSARQPSGSILQVLILNYHICFHSKTFSTYTLNETENSSGFFVTLLQTISIDSIILVCLDQQFRTLSNVPQLLVFPLYDTLMNVWPTNDDCINTARAWSKLHSLEPPHDGAIAHWRKNTRPIYVTTNTRIGKIKWWRLFDFKINSNPCSVQSNLTCLCRHLEHLLL